MKTNELITMLSKHAGAAPKLSVAIRLWPAGILGGLLAAALSAEVLGLIPNKMLVEAGLWIKMIYSGALALAAACLMGRLGRPGASGRQASFALAGVVLLMLGAGLLSYLFTPEPIKTAALLGHSWVVCPLAILGLSLPTMAGSFWAIKGLAPTKLSQAGAACGLFSGAIAALAYALTCTEPATSFIAIWYTLGIALCGALGAFLGPKFLNW